jgi:flavodoxin
MAPPVATFISTHNLSDKTVIPFATHGGGGEQRCLTDIRKLCSNAEVLDGLAFYGSEVETSKNRLSAWIKKLLLFNKL